MQVHEEEEEDGFIIVNKEIETKHITTAYVSIHMQMDPTFETHYRRQCQMDNLMSAKPQRKHNKKGVRTFKSTFPKACAVHLTQVHTMIQVAMTHFEGREEHFRKEKNTQTSLWHTTNFSLERFCAYMTKSLNHVRLCVCVLSKNKGITNSMPTVAWSCARSRFNSS